MNANEKIFIAALIREYVKIHKAIDIYEKKLDKLESAISLRNKGDIKELELGLKTEVERLTAFRDVEKEFWGEIKKKYGPGDFDAATLEYTVDKNAKQE